MCLLLVSHTWSMTTFSLCSSGSTERICKFPTVSSVNHWKNRFVVSSCPLGAGVEQCSSIWKSSSSPPPLLPHPEWTKTRKNIYFLVPLPDRHGHFDFLHLFVFLGSGEAFCTEKNQFLRFMKACSRIEDQIFLRVGGSNCNCSFKNYKLRI